MNINNTCLQFHILNGNVHVTGHHKEFLNWCFKPYSVMVLALSFEEGLTLKTSFLETLHDGKFKLSTQLIN